jgi:hypothetical protein
MCDTLRTELLRVASDEDRGHTRLIAYRRDFRVNPRMHPDGSHSANLACAHGSHPCAMGPIVSCYLCVHSLASSTKIAPARPSG